MPQRSRGGGAGGAGGHHIRLISPSLIHSITVTCSLSVSYQAPAEALAHMAPGRGGASGALQGALLRGEIALLLHLGRRNVNS